MSFCYYFISRAACHLCIHAVYDFPACIYLANNILVKWLCVGQFFHILLAGNLSEILVEFLWCLDIYNVNAIWYLDSLWCRLIVHAGYYMGHCNQIAKSLFIVSSLCCRQSEDSDPDAFRDTTSDSSSSDCGFPRAKFNIKLQNHTLVKNEIESLSLVDKHYELQGDSSSDESEFSDSQGQLLFEYFERSNPYTREPLADKVNIVLWSCIYLKYLMHI